MAEYLLLGAGLALALEGFAYAAAPRFMKRVAAAAGLSDPSQLRLAGICALAIGVLIVALARQL